MRAAAPPMTVPAARIVFSEEDRAEVLALVDESLRTGSLTLGPRTREPENAFAARHQMPFAVAVNSGTSALEIVLRALGAGGREVVVPTNTFFATAAAVVHAGGVPRFADVAADTFALTAASAEAAITPETAGVIVVHVGGVVSPDDEALAAVPGLRPVIPPPGCETNYYKYMALLDDGIERVQVKEQLRLRHGVTLSGEVYAVPLHRQPVFAAYDRGPFPVAEDVCRRQVCLPVHSDMTEAEASHVVGALHAVLDEGAGAGA